MVRDAYIGETVYFGYRAKDNATGQTNIKITVMKLSDKSKTVDDQAMTEVSATNAAGEYRYGEVFTATGRYKVYMYQGTMASPTYLQTETVTIYGVN